MTPEEIAREVVPDPWRDSTKVSLQVAARTLQHHMSDDEVIDLLDSVVGAIRGEYGD